MFSQLNNSSISSTEAGKINLFYILMEQQR